MSSREYRRNWLLVRYRTTRNFLIGLLGGKCVKCFSMENLEFDHIDPTEKTFSIGERLTHPLESIIEEANKCQLLCHKCHLEKTLAYRKEIHSATHGLHSTYSRGCRCDLCRESNRIHSANQRRKHGRKPLRI